VRGARALLVGLAAAGCGPETDAERYLAVLQGPGRDAEADLARCAEIGDAATRGDCALVVAERAEGAPGRLCPSVPEGTWRDECWFSAAEAAMEGGDWKAAIGLCDQAGRFQNDCTWHLWQDELRAVLGPPRKRDLVASLPAARRLHDTWAARLQDGGDFELRYWRRYYEMVLEVGPHLDPTRCAAVGGVDAARCHHATAHLFMRRLLDRVRGPGGDAAFCGLAQPDTASAAAALGLSATPSPLLDAVVEEQFAHRCTRGWKGPYDGVVTSPDAWREAVEAARAAEAAAGP
jgi:hypothetical protein